MPLNSREYKNKESLEIDLESLLVELDPACIVSYYDDEKQHCCNADEYSGEAKFIYPFLRDSKTFEEFHSGVISVWNEMFGTAYGPEDEKEKNPIKIRDFTDSKYTKELAETIWQKLKVDKVMKESVSVLIRDEKTELILGVSRRNDHTDFGLPGGKVEEGEELEDAIKRETFEETGLQIDGLTKIFRRVCDGKTIYNNTTYVADVVNGTPEDREGHKVDWVTTTQLANGTFAEYNKRLFNHLGLKY